MKKMLFIVSVFAVLLTSCAPKTKEGEIYAKDYRRAHTTMIMVPIVRTSGKVTTTTLIPMRFYYPEAWYISYRAFNEKNNKWDSATVWVSQDVYNVAQVGSWYKRTDADFDDQPRVRQK